LDCSIRAAKRDLEKPKRAGGAVWLAPIAAVEDFEASYLLSSNLRLGVPITQFKLANVPADGINFFGYQRRLFETTSSPARRDVTASIDANGRRAGIESGSSIALDYHAAG
jgi:hypothetical protein